MPVQAQQTTLWQPGATRQKVAVTLSNTLLSDPTVQITIVCNPGPQCTYHAGQTDKSGVGFAQPYIEADMTGNIPASVQVQLISNTNLNSPTISQTFA